ncbi:MAG TPA: hypothetical protein VMJ10_33275 [Kofleriaceae bacterium]|nr:hypothetical protein [Kofleriaceae bacterium]
MTEKERLLSPMFDRAMELRDGRRFDEAVELLEQLVQQLGPEGGRLSAHSHMQIGRIRKLQKRPVDSERHFREAVRIAPRLELASLGLFHAIHNLGRHADALGEVVRYLSLRESLGYRELLAGDAFGNGVPDEERRLADEARALLAKHREAQRARDEPVKGDTVRVRSEAHQAARPGSLASVRRVRTVEAGEDALVERVPVGTKLFHVAFSDGETADVPGSLLDHIGI